MSEPKVCGDVPWCGLPAAHAVAEPDDARALVLAGHRLTADGVYDLDAAVYHLDPWLGRSLSSTGARRLTATDGCPAKFHHAREHAPAPRKTWDLGRAVHTKILGRGEPIGLIPADMCAKNGAWSTDAAKAEVTRVRALGWTPLKPDEVAAVDAMAEAVLADPDARGLLEPGASEVAMFWTDPDTGVACRTMLDKLPPVGGDGRLNLADLKTCASAAPDALRRAMGDRGHHQQAEWCVTGVEQLGLCGRGDANMVFVCVEKTAPHIVTLYTPDAMAWMRAAELNRAARVIYSRCERAGRWPGYVDEITGWGTQRIIELSLLPWLENEEITV